MRVVNIEADVSWQVGFQSHEKFIRIDKLFKIPGAQQPPFEPTLFDNSPEELLAIDVRHY